MVPNTFSKFITNSSGQNQCWWDSQVSRHLTNLGKSEYSLLIRYNDINSRLISTIRIYGGVEPWWGLFDFDRELKNITIPTCNWLCWRGWQRLGGRATKAAMTNVFIFHWLLIQWTIWMYRRNWSCIFRLQCLRDFWTPMHRTLKTRWFFQSFAGLQWLVNVA